MAYSQLMVITCSHLSELIIGTLSLHQKQLWKVLRAGAFHSVESLEISLETQVVLEN